MTDGITRFFLSTAGEADNEQLINISKWGTPRWKSMYAMFTFAIRMTCTAKDAPDLSKVKTMMGMFHGCAKFNGEIEHWDFNTIRTTKGMLNSASSFNQSINKINLNNVEETSFMLAHTTSFNQDLRDLQINADTEHMFGYKQSLYQYIAQHKEQDEAKDEQQKLNNALNP